MTTDPSRGAVLIVEDEAMIRMMVADMLTDLGFSIAGEAASIADGVQLARSAEYDVALLDVNLNGEIVEPVARAVAERQRPFLFVSGYGTAGLPDAFRNHPALQKPFKMEALAAALDQALGK
jgi:DNA-binding response OmpR family regulator